VGRWRPSPPTCAAASTDQRKLPGECSVTLAQFDDRYELVYEGRPLAEVPPLELVPRGMTALHDAVGKTVISVGERLAAMSEDARPSKVIVLVISDGGENASKEFGQLQVKSMVTHQREAYGWDFVYLGANQDAQAVAKGIGVSPAASVTYTPTNDGTRGLMLAVNLSVASSRGGGGQTVISQASYADAVARAKASP
jgi:hypothetical protein